MKSASFLEANTSLLAQAQAIVGTRYVLHQAEERLAYECDACVLIQTPPDLVVLPGTAEEVAQLVALCHRHQLPFVARGAGTGLSGGALAAHGGMLISLNRLNRILSIHPEQRHVWVEPGVVNATLNERLAPHGLFYAPDPSSQAACTIGGNVAENAGGIHCFKFGVTTDHVLALEVVLPTGERLTIGNPSHVPDKQGLDLLRLIIGSEGTLGVVTKICLKLMPKPAVAHVLLVAYDQLTQGTDAVSALIAQGLEPAAIELMDGPTIWAVNQALNMGFPEGAQALILAEVSGQGPEVVREAAQLASVFQQFGPSLFQTATDPVSAKHLWKARKGTVAGYGRLQPAFYVHDCVIPRSRLSEVLSGIEAIGQRYGILIANVFHAGDGNLHPNLLFDPKNKAMTAKVFEAGHEILSLCLSVGGTLSGEHGIGLEKIEFMDQQWAMADLDKMRAVRVVFDPEGRANPGKLIPTKRICGEHGLHDTTVAYEAFPLNATRLTTDGETGTWI